MSSVGAGVGVSVKTQVALADGLAGEEEEDDEEEDAGGGKPEGAVEIPSVEAEQDAPPEEEEEKQGSVKDGEFVAAADFVDEVCFFLLPHRPRDPHRVAIFHILSDRSSTDHELDISGLIDP